MHIFSRSLLNGLSHNFVTQQFLLCPLSFMILSNRGGRLYTHMHRLLPSQDCVLALCVGQASSSLALTHRGLRSASLLPFRGGHLVVYPRHTLMHILRLSAGAAQKPFSPFIRLARRQAPLESQSLWLAGAWRKGHDIHVQEVHASSLLTALDTLANYSVQPLSQKR